MFARCAAIVAFAFAMCCSRPSYVIFFLAGPGGKTETALSGGLCIDAFAAVAAELEKCENLGEA
jgi:hypothetical protein